MKINIKYIGSLLFLILSSQLVGSMGVNSYDQTFPSEKLRYGYQYKFTDTFHNDNNYRIGISDVDYTFTEGGNYNSAKDPKIKWTKSFENKGFIVAPNSSEKIVTTGKYYKIVGHPVTRKPDNISMVYDVEFYTLNGQTQGPYRHTEYQPYEITWCGDGVVDNYKDKFTGAQIYEACDPGDPTSWDPSKGESCSNTCEKITVPTPASCDSLTVNPNSGTAPLDSAISCKGTAADSYKIEIKKDGEVVKTFNRKNAEYTFDAAGEYQVKCFVNEDITSKACRSGKVVVNQPEVPVYDLALRKVVNGESAGYKLGEEVVFDITVFNQGEKAVKSFEITDYIPDSLELVSSGWEVKNSKATKSFTKTIKPNGAFTTQVKFKIISDTQQVIRNYAEISRDDGKDCDSATDRKNGNTNGETETTGMVDNSIGKTCGDTDDEDDHDYAEIRLAPLVYDLALRKTLSPETPGPFKVGSLVTFDITVFNQGDADSGTIHLVDYIPDGLTLLRPATEGEQLLNHVLAAEANKIWSTGSDSIYSNETMVNSNQKAHTVIAGIGAGEAAETVSISFIVDDDAPKNIRNKAEILRDSGDDCDSTPDQNPSNTDGETIKTGMVNDAIGKGCEKGGDEDDHDYEDIRITETIYDLTLIKTLVGTKDTFKVGDKVEFDVIVRNTGNVNATFRLVDYIPKGLTLSDESWDLDNSKAYYKKAITLTPNSKTTTRISFTVNEEAAGKIRNFAEISEDDGDDCDSIPDTTNKNQEGETINTGMIDDRLGDGCKEKGDEDDHDYEDIFIEGAPSPVYDLALRKTLSPETPGPFKVGDPVTFDITVFNQGDVDSGTIHIVDYIPEGLTLVDDSWKTGSQAVYSDEVMLDSDSKAHRVITGIGAGEAAETYSISFVINDDAPSKIRNKAEILRDSGFDCDSTPDQRPKNTQGETIDTGMVNDSIGSSCDDTIDEDDHDYEDIIIEDSPNLVYDFYITKKLQVEQDTHYKIGERVRFGIWIYNTGDLPGTVSLVDYIPTGLTLDDENWTLTPEGDKAYYNQEITMNPGDNPRDAYISFIVNEDATPTIRNFAEIHEDDGDDCDSIPDNINGNQDGETIESGMLDDNKSEICGDTEDEDDHDYQDIYVTDAQGSDSVYLIKSLVPGQPTGVSIGDTVNYVITVYNTGSTDAVDYIVKDRFEDASGGALALAPESLSSWSLEDGMAIYDEAITIPAGGEVSQTISFVITDSAEGKVRNFAIVCPDDDPDCGEDIPPVNPVCPADDPDCCEDVFEEGNPYGCVEVVVAACESLVASPVSSTTGTLNTTLTCSAQGAESYKIVLEDQNDIEIDSKQAATWSLNGLGVGNYTAKCYINDEDTTPNSCTAPLTVSNGESGHVGKCEGIAVSGNQVKCYVSEDINSVYVKACNPGEDGPTPSGVKNDFSYDLSGRKYAEFNCNNISPETQCRALEAERDSIGFYAWDDEVSCKYIQNPSCGDGVVNQPGEQCDDGNNNNNDGCSNECKLQGASNTGEIGVLTWPGNGQTIFGPKGSLKVGHTANILKEAAKQVSDGMTHYPDGVDMDELYPYIFNNSDRDINFNFFCVGANDSTDDGVVTGPDELNDYVDGNSAKSGVCLSIPNDVIYAYEKLYMIKHGSTHKVVTQYRLKKLLLENPSSVSAPYFEADKTNIPEGLSYIDANITTTVADDIEGINGINPFKYYFAADLTARVVRPAISTVGGGSSYVSKEDSADIADVTDDSDTNFVGTSITKGGTALSSDAGQATDGSSLGNTTQNNTGSVSAIDAAIDTDGVDEDEDFTSYNGIENVMIASGDRKISDIDIEYLTESTTFIVTEGNLIIDEDISSSHNLAFVVKGGDIEIHDDVTNIEGTFIVMGDGYGINADPSDKQLVVKGSLYGDISQLVDNRYYISNDTTSGFSVGTIVSFGSSLFTKPAPLVGQFVGEYLESQKVAQ